MCEELVFTPALDPSASTLTLLDRRDGPDHQIATFDIGWTPSSPVAT
jgi:hypothetical protein